jgi:hypothetical protein
MFDSKTQIESSTLPASRRGWELDEWMESLMLHLGWAKGGSLLRRRIQSRCAKTRGSLSEGPAHYFVTGPVKHIENLYTVLTKLGGLFKRYNTTEDTVPRAKAGV